MIDTKYFRLTLSGGNNCHVLSSVELGELLDAYDALHAKESPHGPTVKVRIAVAVGADGTWSSAGWARAGVEPDDVLPDHVLIDTAHEFVETSSVAFYWIEAELPLPTETTVAGIVTPAENV